MLDWTFGFFPLLTIMAMVVMGLLAARFVHIDKYYERVINKQNNAKDEIKKLLLELITKDPDSLSAKEKEEALGYMIEAQRRVERYTGYRDNNRNVHTQVVKATWLK